MVKNIRKITKSILDQTYDDFEFLIMDDGLMMEQLTYLIIIKADSRIKFLKIMKI